MAAQQGSQWHLNHLLKWVCRNPDLFVCFFFRVRNLVLMFYAVLQLQMFHIEGLQCDAANLSDGVGVARVLSLM